MEDLDDDTCKKASSDLVQSMNDLHLNSLSLKTDNQDLTKATPRSNTVKNIAHGTICKTLDTENSINGGDLPAKNISLPSKWMSCDYFKCL